jgi:hypothetical protein
MCLGKWEEVLNWLPPGFEPRLIGSEPCLLLVPYSAVNYLELPK